MHFYGRRTVQVRRRCTMLRQNTYGVGPLEDGITDVSVRTRQGAGEAERFFGPFGGSVRCDGHAVKSVWGSDPVGSPPPRPGDPVTSGSGPRPPRHVALPRWLCDFWREKIKRKLKKKKNPRVCSGSEMARAPPMGPTHTSTTSAGLDKIAQYYLDICQFSLRSLKFFFFNILYPLHIQNLSQLQSIFIW